MSSGAIRSMIAAGWLTAGTADAQQMNLSVQAPYLETTEGQHQASARRNTDKAVCSEIALHQPER